MGKHMRGAISAFGILLLLGGMFLLGLGYILRETALLGVLLLTFGALAAVEGALLVAESWWSGRRDL